MWRRFVSPFKEFGMLAGAAYVVDQILRRVSPRLRVFVYELMVQPITNKGLLPKNLSKRLSFIEIERGDPAVDEVDDREQESGVRGNRASASDRPREASEEPDRARLQVRAADTGLVENGVLAGLL